jgi:hypothetical protein
MAPIINGMRRIEGRLKDDAGLDLAWYRIVIVLFLVVVAERIVGGASHTWRRRPCRRFEFAGPLPFWTTGEPEHEPVVGKVFFAKMGSQEEGCNEGLMLDIRCCFFRWSDTCS